MCSNQAPLIVSSDLMLITHALLFFATDEMLLDMPALFDALKQDIELHELDVGSSEEALFDWLELQRIAMIARLAALPEPSP